MISILPARRIIAFAAAALCLGALPGAQQATFRTGIELVQIDVVVLDKDGRHVRGLTAKDFALFDRGKPQTVAAFEEVSHDRPAGPSAAADLPASVPVDVGSNQAVEANRLVVIVVDDLHIWTGRTEIAKKVTRELLQRFGREASMAVLFTSGENSTQVTVDRSRLLAAVDTLKARQSLRRPNQARAEQRTPRLDPEASAETAHAIIGHAQSTSLQQFQDNMSMLTTLRDAARMMGVGDTRRKAFVLVTEGFAKNPTGLFGTMRPAGDAPQGGVAYATTGDPAALEAPRPMDHQEVALIEMMDSMRRSNIATYAIDPRGEVTSQEEALELFGQTGWATGDSVFRWNNPLRVAQDGLSTIAEASGGFAVTNTDDFMSGIDDIVRDLDHYYMLGFYPPEMKGKRFRPVDVKVPGHPDWTVRFRRGYVPEGPKEDDKKQSALVTLSAGVLPKNDLQMRLGAIVLRGAGKDAQVALGIEVSAARESLEEADGRVRDELTYQVLVVDEKKRKVKSATGLRARISLTPSATGERPALATYQVDDRIELPPGRYQLRVSAQSAKLARGGSVYLHVDVPDYNKDALALSGLAIGYEEGSRVAARSTLLPFAPTLDRAFAPTDILRVYLEVTSPAGAPNARGRLELLTPSGEVKETVPFQPDAAGRVHVLMPLSALRAGAHVLRATAADGGATAIREVGFTIR